MPVDFEDPKILGRLRTSIAWSEKQLRTRREQRLEQLRLMVGYHYGENGAAETQPINLIELGVNIYEQQIAPHNLAAWVTSDHDDLLPQAATAELALNHVVKKIGLAESLADAGQEALFFPAVMKVGRFTDGSPPDVDGNYRDAGAIFAEPILGEDLIVDMTAKSRRSLAYIGDRFRVPLEWAMENENYDKKVRQQITSPTMRDNDVNRGGMEIQSQSASIGYSPLMDEFQDHVDLISLYMPFQNEMLVLVDGQDLPPLSRKPWDGQPGGPYRNWLSYGKVRGNLLARGVVPMWVDLHNVTNIMFRKVSNQAERQKTILAVEGRSKEAGSSIVSANDGDAIYTENADGVNEKSTGGPNQTTLAFAMWCKQMLSWLGGNWDAIGGLAPQSDTLGQDRLLIESATGRIQDMQITFMEFTSGVLQDIGYLMWQDPLAEYQLRKPIAGTRLTVPTVWSPETRQGDYFKYNYSVNPYSLKARSPAQQANAITQFVTQILLPALPSLQAQGMSLDWEWFFKTFAKYMHEPELNRFITFAQSQPMMPGMDGGGGGMEQPGMPSVTTRNNVRHNRSTRTQGGMETSMMQSLLSGGNGNNAMAAMGRGAA